MVSIRPMTPEDAVAAQRLLAQLGYPLELQEVRRRYETVVRSADHAVMLADQDGTIVALCHVYVRPALDKPPEVVVQSLVVEQACRGSGMGKRMLAAAEAWAADRGFGSVALASNISRTPAHAFYEALGYRRAATSHQFRKALA